MSSVNRLLACKHYRVGGDGSKICVNDLQFPIPVILSEIRVIAAGQSSAAMFVGETQEEAFVLEIFVKNLDVEDAKFEALTRGTQSVRVRKSARITRLKEMRTSHVAFRGKYKSLSLCLYGRIPSNDPNLNALHSVQLPKLDLSLAQKYSLICAAETETSPIEPHMKRSAGLDLRALDKVYSVRMAKELKFPDVVELLSKLADGPSFGDDVAAERASDLDIQDSIVCTILERAIRKSQGTREEQRVRDQAFLVAQKYFAGRHSKAAGLIDLANEIFAILETFVCMTSRVSTETVLSCLDVLRTLILCASDDVFDQWLMKKRWYSTLVGLILSIRAEAGVTRRTRRVLLIWHVLVKVAWFVRTVYLTAHFPPLRACNLFLDVFDSTERLLRDNRDASESISEETLHLLPSIFGLIVRRCRSQGMADAWCLLLARAEDKRQVVVSSLQALSVWQGYGLLPVLMRADMPGFARLFMQLQRLLEHMPTTGAIVMLRHSLGPLKESTSGLPVSPTVFVDVCVNALCVVAAACTLSKAEETRRLCALDAIMRISTTSVGQIAISRALSQAENAVPVLEVAKAGPEFAYQTKAAAHVFSVASGRGSHCFARLVSSKASLPLLLSLTELGQHAREDDGKESRFDESVAFNSVRLLQESLGAVEGEADMPKRHLEQVKSLLLQYEALSNAQGEDTETDFDKSLLDLTAVLSSLAACLEIFETRLSWLRVDAFRSLGSAIALEIWKKMRPTQKPNDVGDAASAPLPSGEDGKTDLQEPSQSSGNGENCGHEPNTAKPEQAPDATSASNEQDAIPDAHPVVSSQKEKEIEREPEGMEAQPDATNEEPTDDTADDVLESAVDAIPAEGKLFLVALQETKLLGHFLKKVRRAKYFQMALERTCLESPENGEQAQIGEDMDQFYNRRRFLQKLCAAVTAALNLQTQVCRVFEALVDPLSRESKAGTQPLLRWMKTQVMDTSRAETILNVTAQISLLVSMYVRALQLQTNSPSMVFGPGLGVSYKLGFGLTTQTMIRQPAVNSYLLSAYPRSCVNVHAAVSVLFSSLCRIYKKTAPAEMDDDTKALDPLALIRNMLSESPNGVLAASLMLWYLGCKPQRVEFQADAMLKAGLAAPDDCSDIMDDDLVYTITLQLLQSSDAFLLDIAADLCRNTMQHGRGARLAARLVRMVLDSLSRTATSTDDPLGSKRSARIVVFALHLLENEQLRRELNASSTFPPLTLETPREERGLQKACLLALQCQVDSLFADGLTGTMPIKDLSSTTEGDAFVQRLGKIMREVQGHREFSKLLCDAPDIARDISALQLKLRTRLPETPVPKAIVLANLLGYEESSIGENIPKSWASFSLDNPVNLFSLGWGLGFVFCCVESKRMEASKGLQEVYPELLSTVENVRARVNFATACLKDTDVVQQKVLLHLKGMCELLLETGAESEASAARNPDPNGDVMRVYSLQNGWSALEAAYFEMIHMQPENRKRSSAGDTNQTSKKTKVEGR